LNVLFAEIAVSMNMGIVDGENSGKAIVIGNAIAWVVTGLIALFAGAWVAGRMASARTRLEGSLHGLAVWAAGAVVMLLLAFGAAGALGSGMLNVVGKSLEGAGNVVALAMPSSDAIQDELGAALDRGSHVAGNPAGGSTAESAIAGAGAGNNGLAERSRLVELAKRRFELDAKPLETSEQRDMVQLMASQLGTTQATAEKTLAQWDAVWQRTVDGYEMAKQKAAQAAEEARVLVASAAGWAAVAMVLGALAALVGGAFGTRCRIEWRANDALDIDRVLPVRETLRSDGMKPLTAAHPLS
jgi:hypothetical protein